MAKFRKRPEIVEAVQFVPAKHIDAKTGKATLEGLVVGSAGTVACRTPSGLVHVEAGDWIIYRNADDIYPCKPDRFAEIFIPVEEE